MVAKRVNAKLGMSPFVEGFAIHIAHALPRRDARQMRRLLRGDMPLADRKRRRSRHGDLAVAPALPRGPLDEIVAVLAILDPELVLVAVGITDASNVDVDDGVTVAAPIRGVGRLELRHLRYGALGNARRVPHVLARAVFVRPLSVVRPREDRGNARVLTAVGGAEDIAIQLRPVAHLNRDVLLADNTRRRLVNPRVERIRLRLRFLLLAHMPPSLKGNGFEHLHVNLIVGLSAEHLPHHGLLALWKHRLHALHLSRTVGPNHGNAKGVSSCPEGQR